MKHGISRPQAEGVFYAVYCRWHDGNRLSRHVTRDPGKLADVRDLHIVATMILPVVATTAAVWPQVSRA